MNRSTPRTWDLFCRVVDNFGDAAFGWRLARQLANEHGARVRLWIDDPATLARLVPAVDPAFERQTVEGVAVCRWEETTEFGAPADVVIDAFGGGLPERYAEAMAARTPRSLWIVTEYLSAEPWVATHHAKPSPHPRLPLERWFFFPGFERGTGGLLREAGYAARRARFEADPGAARRLWPALGMTPPAAGATVVSLFAYDAPSLDGLLDAWQTGAPIVLVVPLGRVAPAVAERMGVAAEPGTIARRGALEARFVPFMPQPRYDELLWASDWNFVRGEDSFVRAQWAARPFCWHIYPQADAAHRVKLDAFLARYTASLPPALRAAFVTLWHGWNGEAAIDAGAMASAWGALRSPDLAPTLAAHARDWAAGLERLGEFGARLVDFCRERWPAAPR